MIPTCEDLIVCFFIGPDLGSGHSPVIYNLSFVDGFDGCDDSWVIGREAHGFG